MAAPVHIQPTAGKKLQIAERERQIIPLLLAGASGRQVAEMIGVDKKTISLDIKRIMARWAEEHKEARNKIAATTLARYESLFLTVYPLAKNGDDAAMGRAIQILKALRELFGLDAPIKVDARHQEIPGEGGTLIDRMQQRYLQEQATNVVEGTGRSVNGHRSDEP